MEKFEASNGVTVNETPYVGFKMLTLKTPDNRITLAGVHVDALREFFQHERDEELGRWRDLRYPDHVVYPVARTPQVPGRGVQVLDERTGRLYDRWEAPTAFDEWDTSPRELAARAYFETHPERKPWHDAKPWETWVFTIDGKEQSATLDEDREFRDRSFRTCSWMHVKDDRISAARRIWPED